MNNLMLTYDEAKADHATVPLLVDVFKQIGVADEGQEFWDAITDGTFQPTTTVGAQIALWMPVDAIPLVRARSVIAAAFALACIAEQCALYFQANQALPTDPQVAAKIIQEAWAKFDERRALADTLSGGGIGNSLDACWEHARAVQQAKDPSVIAEIKKIADMAGKMYQALQNAGPTIEVEGVGEVRNIERGGEIEKVLPEDLAKAFDDSALGDAGTMALVEGKTNQYAMMQVVPGSRGPLVILRDESGSMADDGRDKNTWASAASVALARTAHDGGRVASVVHYASATVVTDLMPGDSQALLTMAQHFLGGGTATGLAMEKGIQRVQALAAQGHVGADIVLITDGDDSDYPRIEQSLNKMDQLGIDLYTVLIECSLPDTHPLIARAKKVVRVGSQGRAAASHGYGYPDPSSQAAAPQQSMAPTSIAGLIDAAMNRPGKDPFGSN